MQESDDSFPDQHQAPWWGRAPSWHPEGLTQLSPRVSFATAVRLGRGIRVTSGLADARRPASPLELYNVEGSPYCRKVREALCELDLEHIVRNVPKGSRKREALLARAGKVQVPYLVDPNTGSEMFESDDIVTYLHEQYGPGAPA